MAKSKPAIEEHVWDFTKMTKDIYVEPNIVEEWDSDNEDNFPILYAGYDGYTD